MNKTVGNIVRRIEQLTATPNDAIVKLTIVKIDGVLYLCVENGRLERVGKR